MSVTMVTKLEPDALDDDAAAPAYGFKCLDVWDKRQGELRLSLYSVAVAFLALITVRAQLWVLLCLNIENVDTRDIVDDFRLTHKAVQEHHNMHFINNGPRLTMSLCDIPGDPSRLVAAGCTPAVINDHAQHGQGDLVKPFILQQVLPPCVVSSSL
jgi:hypothetical protein